MTTHFAPFFAESIDLRAGHPGAFCVEASAGTGKTYSITGLVLRLVCEQDLPLDEILVVTFTRAAAAELRGRIAERLAAAERDLEGLQVDAVGIAGIAGTAGTAHAIDTAGSIDSTQDSHDASAAGGAGATRTFSDDFVERWVGAALAGCDPEAAQARIALWIERIRRARQRVDAATFTTIHAFCQRMLEWHAFESDQPLGIAFAEDEERLRNEIANDLWAELVERLAPDTLAWTGLSAASLVGALQLALQKRTATLWAPDAAGAQKKASDSAGTQEKAQDAEGPQGEVYDAAGLQEKAPDAEGAREEMSGAARGQENASNWSATLERLGEQLAGGLAPLSDPRERALLEPWLRLLFETAPVSKLQGSRGLAKRSGEAAAEYRTRQLQRVEALQRPPAAGGPEVSLLRGVVDALRAADAESPIELLGTTKKARSLAESSGWLENPWTERIARLSGGESAPDLAESALLLAACHEARARYTQRLAERSEATFDDLITRLADRVEAEANAGAAPRPLTDAVRRRFSAALIDEFQDTDDAQWTLFRRVFLDSDAHRLFLIGDPKQAIYGFRGADIHTYLAARSQVHRVARARLERAGTGDEEALLRAGLYTMTRNFRSDGALIVALNRFLGGLHAEEVESGEGVDGKGDGGLGGDQPIANGSDRVSHARKPSSPVTRSGPPGTPVAGFFDRLNGPASGIDYILVDWQKPRPRATEEDCVVAEEPPSRLALPGATGSWTAQPLVMRPVAAPLPVEERVGDPPILLDSNEACKRVLPRVVAADIRRLLESGARIVEGEEARTVGAGDVAVLVHSWRLGHSIAGQLRSQGVPVVIMAGEVVWTCDEAEELAIVLEALLNLRRPEQVRAALATPLLAVTPTQLASLAGEDSVLLERWLETLGGLAAIWERHGLLRVAGALLDLQVDPTSGLPGAPGGEGEGRGPTRREALLACADGERRLTNLLQIVELLHTETSGQFLGAHGQLDLLRARMAGLDSGASTPDDPRKQRLDTDDQAVRITTVHGSKGLEYPIVFLPSFDAKGVGGRVEAPTVVAAGDPAAGAGASAGGESAAAEGAEVEVEAGEGVAGQRGAAGGTGAALGTRSSLLYASKSILEAAESIEKPPPRQRREKDLEEESRRLLYVGLTRAKHQAVLYVRDWARGTGERAKVSAVGELLRGGHEVSGTALGRLLGATPRVRQVAGDPELCEHLADMRIGPLEEPDRHWLVGDLCLALGKAVNPVGRTLFRVPRRPEDLPAEARERWTRPGAETDAALELPAPIARAHFYDGTYQRGSFSSLASGAAHGAPGGGQEVVAVVGGVGAASAASAAGAAVEPDAAGEQRPAPALSTGHTDKEAQPAGAGAGSGEGAAPHPDPEAWREQDAHEAAAEYMRDRAGQDEPLAPDPEEDEGDATGGPGEEAGLLFAQTRLFGRDFGTAIHELLEKADFGAPLEAARHTDGTLPEAGGPTGTGTSGGAPRGIANHTGDASLREATAQVLRRFGFQLDGAQVHALAADVRAFLHAPLGGPLRNFSLAQVPRQRRIDELEFLLPLRRTLSAGALADAFRAGGLPESGTSWAHAPGAWERWLAEVETLSFRAFHGYLTGFVDLLFATEDAPARLHLLDYKTNKLHTREQSAPEARAAYGQAALVEAMIGSRYVLQYHLYLVALHRFLRSRLGENYDWDAHMGGAWYPFLRGVQPAASAPLQGDALRRGVFHDRPPRERILALDALFEATP